VNYLRQGFVHVVPYGLDHILFVVGLFLLSRSWRPLLAQVTTFTLAHSITLAIATIGLIKVPASVVEPVIAASIAFIAVENILRPKYSPWRLLVVFVFGLIHGLGFAGALNELDLPTSSLVIGLVGFNVGVETGQLCVITLAFMATNWIREAAPYRRWIVIPGSVAIASLGVWWTFERIFGGA
jgi:hydrogenase/urease accessory protein HupE